MFTLRISLIVRVCIIASAIELDGNNGLEPITDAIICPSCQFEIVTLAIALDDVVVDHAVITRV